MTLRPSTLFLRLLILTLPVEALILALFGAWLIRAIERREGAAFDERLRVQCRELIGGGALDSAGELRVEVDLRAVAPGTLSCLVDGRGTILWELPQGWFEASGLRPTSRENSEVVQTAPMTGGRLRVLDSAKRIRKPDDADLATGPLVEAVVAEPLSSLDEANAAFRKKAGAAAIALLALTALLLWAAIKAGLSPVRDMTLRLQGVPGPAGAERLDEGMILRELRPLAREINGLSDRLWGMVQLEKRFTAEAAHQLRTPLTLVKSTLQTALLTGGSPEDHERALREALEDLQRLEQTAESLLALARADARAAGHFQTSENIPLQDLLSSLAERFAPAAGQKDLKLALDLRPAALQGERDSLEQLFANLLDNAVKYTKPGGTITLLCFRDGGSALAAVEDSGPPIPEDDRHHLFEQFYRGKSGRAAGIPGSGLGLSIAAAMARLHGAELTYEPCGLGGNRFAVRFPSPAQGESRPHRDDSRG